MAESNNNLDTTLEQIQNLTEQNKRLGEGLAWLVVRNGELSCRKFRTITGERPEKLKDIGIVSINQGGKPMFYINRFYDEGTAVHEGSMEDINRDLLESLTELEKAGFEIPVDLTTENLVFRLDSHSDWLSRMNGVVWYGNTEKARRIDESTFGYPLIVRKGKSLSLTEKGKEICREMEILEEFDPSFAQRLDNAEETGVYTAINEQTEVFFSWIYSKFREAELTQEQMEFVLTELESSLKENDVKEPEVDEAIQTVLENSEAKQEEGEE